jgi:signal transduction histidine kinase/CheY-like chemotaxis protein
LTKGGNQVPHYFTGFRTMIDEVPYLIGTAIDITDLKRAHDRLRDAQKLESLGVLAAGLAHDFNNLLVGVIGNASLVQDILPPGHPALEFAGRIVKTGEQAAHLTRQMLAYSGKGRFLVEPIDLSDLVPEINELVQPSIPKKIAVRLTLAPDLPSIEADRGQMQQVVMNLILNASEAIGSSAGLISVRTGVRELDDRYVQDHPESAGLSTGKYVCLEVRDTGCGMEEATRAKIFDPFFSTKFAGRGLGLAAVAGIVRSQKGAIEVTSELGKGSCFTILVPGAERAAKVSPLAAAVAAGYGSGMILVVDDEEMVRDLAKASLVRYGFNVLLADGGPAAIDIFKREPRRISLVLLDSSMPGMSGQEVLLVLRSIRPEVKVVVSSGYTESETMRIFLGQQVSGFIQKPYTSSRLAEKVKSAIG